MLFMKKLTALLLALLLCLPMCAFSDDDITATAICPGPMETEFLDAGDIRGKSKDFDALPRCNPRKTALLALKAAKAGKVICTPTAFYRFYRLLAKVLPHAIVVHLAKCY